MLRTRSALLAAPALSQRAPARRSLADHVLSLQRTAGNRATRRLLQRDSKARA